MEYPPLIRRDSFTGSDLDARTIDYHQSNRCYFSSRAPTDELDLYQRLLYPESTGQSFSFSFWPSDMPDDYHDVTRS